ncbi:MAG: hypothetical protein JWM72_1545, partial [Actinomycetia bacterium]|nr:hypothetical protein [Actinomycetes bacterium]
DYPRGRTVGHSVRVKEYVGFIWIGDAPGIRLSILAESSTDAREQVVQQYGDGHVISIWNEDDARKPREP